MPLTTTTKIVKIIKTMLENRLSSWEEQLDAGDLTGVETDLRDFLHELHRIIMQHLLEKVGSSNRFKKRLLLLGLRLGMSDFRLRQVRLQIGTGDWVTYKSYYAYEVSSHYQGNTRHLSHLYWGCVDRASPRYFSQVSMLSVVCPSFDLADQVLKELGIESNYNRIRNLGVTVGRLGSELGIAAQLDAGENMEGLRVVVQIDGGRSRMREANGKKSQKGYQKYDTPWREPKLIVIHTLDEKGHINETIRKPLYQASIQDAAACMEDLVQTLKIQKVDKAKEIQFLADGAPFIWKRIRNAFGKAGVAAKKITYTLDYYHAVEHLKELSELLPWTKEERTQQFEEWKTWLWQGLANSIARNFKKHIKAAGKQLSKIMKTPLNYFNRHHDRMQYKRFRRRKLLCGSGSIICHP
ncbi:MAG: hypothetical protein GY705_10480 [Bacteroidetes bacterium]|nr:hypothetical protein [Bacteroidota bacterium]